MFNDKKGKRIYLNKPKTRELTKRTVLHELYHHLAYVSDLDLPEKTEERVANDYARDFLSKRKICLSAMLLP
jgi:Zn-dependent peptidase ImmA (M78 family)